MNATHRMAQLSKTQQRTYRRLMDCALALFEEGRFVSISELAQECGISRATAYRYFATQNELVTDVVQESLKPMLDWQPLQASAKARVDDLLEFAYPQMLKHEGALRAALLLSLQQWQASRLETSEHLPKNRHADKLIRGNRKQILSAATAPLKQELSPELYQKVLHALSLIYGSEVFMVLKDIWHLDDAGIQSVTQWVANAILTQAWHDQQVSKAPEMET